jgi:hypothetical protein
MPILVAVLGEVVVVGGSAFRAPRTLIVIAEAATRTARKPTTATSETRRKGGCRTSLPEDLRRCLAGISFLATLELPSPLMLLKKR